MNRPLAIGIAFAVLSVPVLFAAGAQEKTAAGIILPSKDEPRWIQDGTRLLEALKKDGISSEILFSQGDPAREKAAVTALISAGAKVIIICPSDSSAAAEAADKAHAAGVKVISFDRLIRDSASVDYYVTFDSVAVGAAEGRYLVSKATAKGTSLYLYAGAASDENTFQLFQGAWGVLQPKIQDGTFVIRNSSEAVALQGTADLSRDEERRIIAQITTNWNFSDARSLAEANLAAAPAGGKGSVCICAPNDGTARAIADAFAADREVTGYTITGQGAEIASIQYIIDGRQSMTVLKDSRVLVEDAVGAAVAYLHGGVPPQTTSYYNGRIEVPSKPSILTIVAKDNVKAAIVDSGYWPAGNFAGL